MTNMGASVTLAEDTFPHTAQVLLRGPSSGAHRPTADSTTGRGIPRLPTFTPMTSGSVTIPAAMTRATTRIMPGNTGALQAASAAAILTGWREGVGTVSG